MKADCSIRTKGHILKNLYHYLFSGLIILVFTGLSGCMQSDPQKGKMQTSLYGFLPAKISFQRSFTKILPADKNRPGQIVAFIELKDQFEYPMKALGKFRYELFKYRPGATSPDPRGKRYSAYGIQVIDLTDIKKNQQHWDNITRCYKFYLRLPEIPLGMKIIVLQVNFILSESEYRLEDRLILDVK